MEAAAEAHAARVPSPSTRGIRRCDGGPCRTHDGFVRGWREPRHRRRDDEADAWYRREITLWSRPPARSKSSQPVDARDPRCRQPTSEFGPAGSVVDPDETESAGEARLGRTGC